MKIRYSLLSAALCCGLFTQQTLATNNFAVMYQQQIAPFWHTVAPAKLSLPDGTTLPYVLITPEKSKATPRINHILKIRKRRADLNRLSLKKNCARQ